MVDLSKAFSLSPSIQKQKEKKESKAKQSKSCDHWLKIREIKIRPWDLGAWGGFETVPRVGIQYMTSQANKGPLESKSTHAQRVPT